MKKKKKEVDAQKDREMYPWLSQENLVEKNGTV